MRLIFLLAILSSFLLGSFARADVLITFENDEYNEQGFVSLALPLQPTLYGANVPGETLVTDYFLFRGVLITEKDRQFVGDVGFADEISPYLPGTVYSFFTVGPSVVQTPDNISCSGIGCETFEVSDLLFTGPVSSPTLLDGTYSAGYDVLTVTTQAEAPEPGSLALLSTGLLGILTIPGKLLRRC